MTTDTMRQNINQLATERIKADLLKKQLEPDCPKCSNAGFGWVRQGDAWIEQRCGCRFSNYTVTL